MYDGVFAAQAWDLPLNCLETFLSVAHHQSYVAAARELGISDDTVTARIASLERALLTPLVNSKPRFEIMHDGEAFIPIVIQILEQLRNVAGQTNLTYDQQTKRLFSLTIGTLYQFKIVCQSRGRKDAMLELERSASSISRTCSEIEKAMGLGELLIGRSTIHLSSSGLKIRDTVNFIIKILADFEGRISIGYVDKPTLEDRLTSSISLIAEHIPFYINFWKQELVKLGRSKRGKKLIDKKTGDIVLKINTLEQLSKVIHSSESDGTTD